MENLVLIKSNNLEETNMENLFEYVYDSATVSMGNPLDNFTNELEEPLRGGAGTFSDWNNVHENNYICNSFSRIYEACSKID